MALVHYEAHQVDLKIVYCGPPGTGKSSCLDALHRSLDPPPEAPIVTLRTGADCTLLFEFPLPDLTLLDGFATRCQISTVPGTVTFNVPHRLVLRDADAVVFITNSHWDAVAGNLQSLAQLEDNLKCHQTNLDSIPLVLQYNKRDLPDIAPLNYLEFLLNRRATRTPSFESSVTNAEGIFEPLNAALHLAVRQFREQKRNRLLTAGLGIGFE
jgi:mutual gliding-motility protein MglA